MALGTIDSVKHIERCLKLGTIEITETSYGWQVKGDTYPVKEYLKKEFDAHWNKDAQAWDIVVMDCYSDGRNHYHYTLLNEACKPAEQPEQAEQPETADDETGDNEAIACEIRQYSVNVIDNDGNEVCRLYTSEYPGYAAQFFNECREGFSSFDKALALVENGEIVDWYAPSGAFTYIHNRIIDEALS